MANKYHYIYKVKLSFTGPSISLELAKPENFDLSKQKRRHLITALKTSCSALALLHLGHLIVTEAVPSINFGGRQHDVSYSGRHVYGEIVFCSNAFLHELLVYEYCQTKYTYICDPC